MSEQRSLIEDSVRLVESILKSLPSSMPAFVVTITQSPKDQIQPPFMEEEYIFPAFGYIQPRVPELLIPEGIMESYVKGLWYQGISKFGAIKSKPLEITLYGWEKKYLSNNEEVRLVMGSDFDFFHTYSFWTTKEKLRSFLQKYENTNNIVGNFVRYENQQLIFTLADGSIATASFVKASELRPVFETFWRLRNKKPLQTILFETKEFHDMYQELFKAPYARILSDDVSNIRKLVYHNGISSDRFKLEYKDKKWLFLVM